LRLALFRLAACVVGTAVTKIADATATL
jgi:hypothetical protein